MNTYELYHHGILGQKWGIRRYQNPDGTLTNEGHQRIELLNSKKKSKHRQKLEQKYMGRGMSKDEAILSADARIKTEKILAVVGGVAVATAAAVVAAKHYDQTVDKYIDTNAKIQNIGIFGQARDPSNPFYGAVDSSDKTLYKGLMAGDHFGGLNGKDVYNTTLKAKTRLKVASPANAEKVFKNLLTNDTEYRDLLTNAFGQDPDTVAKFKLNKYDNGWYKRMYEAANQRLVDHSERGNKLSSKLYNALRNAGYDAIQDVNDKKFSGYGAKNPLIYFGGKDKLVVESFSKMNVDDIRKNYNYVRAKQTGKAIVTGLLSTPLPAVIPAGIAIKKNQDNNRNDYYVKQYRKKHPNTKMSYYQILASLNKQT